jgi:uncharacterized protein YcsI (UPF0317 family)
MNDWLVYCEFEFESNLLNCCIKIKHIKIKIDIHIWYRFEVDNAELDHQHQAYIIYQYIR